jgi:hypothetical protein
MYQGGFAAQEESAKRKEEYLLGRAVDKLPDQGKPEPKARVRTSTRSFACHTFSHADNILACTGPKGTGVVHVP